MGTFRANEFESISLLLGASFLKHSSGGLRSSTNKTRSLPSWHYILKGWRQIKIINIT